MADTTEHWCMGCPYATFLGDRFSCPFVVGSCIRLPHTMERPDPTLIYGFDFRLEYAKRRIERRLKNVEQSEQRGGDTDEASDGQ